ncbi:MAG: type II secretion system protein [Verrucomicrobiae bacterium]|nr:type II secretion system protein [Verrucomicrobiae bacterium]
MKLLHRKRTNAGLTLIEVTLVVAVLLGLIGVIFIGATSYKEGSNRSMCILHISQLQKGVRAYQNLYQKNFGDSCPQSVIVGAGKMIEVAPTCPSGGTYTWLGTIPPLDTAYLTCSLASARDHQPRNTLGW